MLQSHNSELLQQSRKVHISASMMCVDWLNAGDQLRTLESQNIDFLHMDVVDGRFAPDFTMGSSIIEAFRERTNMPFDYHLMVEEPSSLFDAFPVTAKDIFTIHAECCRNLHRDLVAIRRRQAKVGVAICPATPIDVLDYVIEDVDHVIIMTVNPGYKGQKLVPQTLRKVEKLRKLITDMSLDITISVDGNVNYENIPLMIEAGADFLVGGSSGIFRKDMPLADAIRRFREAIDEGLARK